MNMKFTETFSRLLLIAVLAVIIYSNSFSASWHLDDYPSVLENYRIKSLSSSLNDIIFNTRGICDLTFAANYYFCKKEVFWYHITNLIIHIVSAIMVYLLIKITFLTLAISQSDNSPVLLNNIPLIGSLFFIVHPLQTQAVTYIAQRYTSLATMFYLIALVLFIKARINLVNGNINFFSKSHISFYLCSFLCTFLAIRTKEIAMTIPFVFLLYEKIFLRQRAKKVTNILYYLLPFFILLLIPIITRVYTINPDFTKIEETLGRSFKDTVRISRIEYAFTSINVVLTYIRLLLFPVNQNIHHDYPVSSSLFANYTYLSLLVHICILIFAAVMYRKSKLITFGILWFYVTLSVESSVIPIRDVIYEHRVYLPSVGFVFFLAGLLTLKSEWKNIFYIFFAIIISMLSITTYNRNSIWKDELTLWNDCLLKSKNNFRPYLYIGMYYSGRGLLDKSIEKYKKTLEINPYSFEAHNNLGYALEKKGLFNMAAYEYMKAIEIRLYYPEAHNNLGNMFYNQGRVDLAIKEYLIASKSNPYLYSTHYNLGNVYFSLGKITEAVREFKTAIKLNPDYPENHYNLGRVYYNQGKFEDAVKEYQIALKINPNFPSAHNYLGIVYCIQGKLEDGKKEFETAINLKPNYPEAHYNLGNVYYDKRRFEDAIREYQTALKINPDFVLARKAIESMSK